MQAIKHDALTEARVLRFVQWMHESIVELKMTPEGRAKLAAMHEARMRREAEARSGSEAQS